MPKSLVLIALLCLLAPMPAVANEPRPNLDANAIVAQQEQIRSDVIARKGRYKDLPAADRENLLKQQATVFHLLQDRTTVTELPETDRIALVNALETIEGIANRAQDERMVCERVRRVGSNRPETVCMTAAERRQRREADAQALGTRNSACIRSGDGCSTGW